MDINNEKITDKRIFGYMFTIYAYAYTKQEEYKKAIEYNYKAIEAFNQAKDPRGINDIYVNLSTNYLALDNQDSVWHYIQKGLTAIQHQNAPMTNAQLLINLGEYYQNHGQYSKAGESYRNAIEISKKINHLQSQKEANQKLAEMYEELHKPGLALSYFKAFQQTKDSLLNEEKQRQIAQINIKYETEKIEQENQLLINKNKMIQLEVEKRNRQNLIIGITSINLLLISGLIILLINLKRKKEQQESKIGQLKAKDEERNVIAKKLHDEIKNDLIGFRDKLIKINEPELSNEIEKTTNQLRQISHELVTYDFEKRPFEEQIKDLLADNIDENLYINYNNLMDINWKQISDSTKKTLFLVIREAVYNIRKHSQANEAKIDFVKNNKKISVTISDNGIGFDQDDNKPGLGLRNIITRVNTLNGEVKILSQKKKGTKLFIQMMI
jgi:signal transduction histidine kinase